MTRHQNQPHRTFLRTGLSALLLTFIFLGFSHSAFAISCGCLSDLDLIFKKSDAVFIGMVMKVNRETSYLTIINVEKVWKGVPGKKVILEWDVCDVEFEANKRYLVFARKWQGKFYQWGCGSVFEVKEIDVMLRVLELMLEGKEEKKILEEIFVIIQSHENVSFRKQAVELLAWVYGEHLKIDNLPKGAWETLNAVRKNSDPKLSLTATKIMSHVLFIKQKVNPKYCPSLKSPWKAYQASKTVFLGRVVSLKNERDWYKEKNFARFEIEKAWKGIEGEKLRWFSHIGASSKRVRNT
jgi:hypothetical protein